MRNGMRDTLTTLTAIMLTVMVAASPVAGLSRVVVAEGSVKQEPAGKETINEIVFYIAMTSRLLRVIESLNISINESLITQATELVNTTPSNLTNLTREQASTLLKKAEAIYEALLQAYMNNTPKSDVSSTIHESLARLLIGKLKKLGESLNNTNLIQLANNLEKQVETGNVTIHDIDEVDDLIEHALASDFSRKLSQTIIIYIAYIQNSNNVSNSTIIAVTVLEDLEDVVKALQKTITGSNATGELAKSIAGLEGSLELLNSTATLLKVAEESGIEDGNTTKEALYKGLNSSIRDLIKDIKDANNTLNSITANATQLVQTLIEQARSNLTEAMIHANASLNMISQGNNIAALEEYMVAKGYYKTAENLIDVIESILEETMKEENASKLLDEANELLEDINELRVKAQEVLQQANQTNSTTAINLVQSAINLLDQAENLTNTTIQLIQNNTNSTLAWSLLIQAHDKKEEAEKLIELASEAIEMVGEHGHGEEEEDNTSLINQTPNEEHDETSSENTANASDVAEEINHYQNKLAGLTEELQEYEVQANQSNNTEALNLITQAKELVNSTLQLLNQAEQALSNNDTATAKALLEQASQQIEQVENLIDQIKHLLGENGSGENED